jgi:integrase
LAPRSQVLKQLRIGSSFIKEQDGRYWVKVLAELSKNGKPTMFALPLELTSIFDVYIKTVRKRILNNASAAASEKNHDYLFFKHNGTAPRSEFSTLTNLVTQQVIGRPINAHAFRSATITAFYETGASQTEMNILANIMAHDPSTARNFYYRPQFSQAAIQANERMMEFLLGK